MKRILCIRLPDWPLQRLTVARPELKGQPVLLHETRRGTQSVVACSAEAMSLGVAVGMPLAEASSLGIDSREGRRGKRGAKGAMGSGEWRVESEEWRVESGEPVAGGDVWGQFAVRNLQSAICNSPLIPRPYDPLADRRALEALAEWSGRFSPVVGLEDAIAAESLLLDVTGLAHLFGGETPLAEEIVRDFARRGLTVHVAVADTLGAAWAVARFHSAFSIQHSAFNIQHSAFSIHHSSFLLVPLGKTLPALRPLPVAALRIAEETVELLHQLGIDRLGQLETLPRRELSSRFGPELLRRWDQAVGRLAEPVQIHAPPPQFEADWSPEHPVARRETVEAALEQLIGQIAGRLARLGRGAVRLECRLDCGPGGSAGAEPVRVVVGLFRPTAAAEHLSSLVRLQLQRLRLPGPLAGMHVAVTATAPLLEQQQEMFFRGDGFPRRYAYYLAELIERLSSRLGRRSVLRARLHCDAQPELAWHYDPLVDDSRRRRSQGATTNATKCPSVPGLSGSAARARPGGRGRAKLGGRGRAKLGGRGRAKRAPGGPVAGGPLRGTPATLLPPRPLRLLRRPVAIRVTSIAPGGLSRFSRSENGTVPFLPQGENGTVPCLSEEAVPLRFEFAGRDHRIAKHWGPERIETGWWRGRVVGRDYYHVETTTGHRYWLFRRLRDGRWFLHGMFE